MQLRSFADQHALIQSLVTEILTLVNSSDKPTFNLVVTGGGLGIKTIEALGKQIRQPSRLRIIFCDERFVEKDSKDRNEAQAEAVWPGVSQTQLIRYPAKLGSVEAAANTFSAELSDFFGEITSPSPVFDLVLLGVGDDGHIASLFPNSSYFKSWVVAESNSPKPPRERLSLSYEALNRSDRIWFVVGGANKAEAVRRIRNGENLPAAKVAGKRETLWWIDQELSDEL
jgi:6-phosphogluconolactonase